MNEQLAPIPMPDPNDPPELRAERLRLFRLFDALQEVRGEIVLFAHEHQSVLLALTDWARDNNRGVDIVPYGETDPVLHGSVWRCTLANGSVVSVYLRSK